MARQVELIVEDGSIVPDANSFVDEIAIVAYFKNRGIDLPSETDEELDAVATLSFVAMDYLAIQRWKGFPVDPNQDTPWPRRDLGSNPPFPDNQVPASVKEAQLSLIMIAYNGNELIPYLSGAGVILKDKIGPIETQYSEKYGVSDDGLPILPGVTALLEPWVLPDLKGMIPVMISSVGAKEPWQP